MIGGGDTYYAAFSEAGGLKANDEVRVAGVRVGKVETVELDGDHVKVTFRVESGVRLRQGHAAAIKVKTLLGRDVPRPRAGRRRPARRGAPTIPVERTTSPYDVVEAFAGLAETSEQIDTDQLAQSLATLADLTRNTPEEFRGRPRRASRRSPPTSRPATTRSTPCSPTCRTGLGGARRPRPGHRRADEGRRRAVPGAGGPAARPIHNLLVSTSTLSEQLTALIRQSPRRPQAGPRPPGARGRRAQQERGQPRQTACG